MIITRHIDHVSLHEPNPFIEGGESFTAAVRGTCINYNILALLESVSQVAWSFAMPGSEKLDTLKGSQTFFYHLIRGVLGANAKFEKNLDLGTTLNPILLKNAFTTRHQLTIDDLKTKKILLSYSGGKESVLLKHMLTELGANFDCAHIYDTMQTATEPKDWQVKLGNIFQFHPSAELIDYGVPPPIVIYQRILIWAYAEGLGYDYVIFGDEIDNQAMYDVAGKLYPSGCFFQSQYFYNILNSLGLGKTKLASGLMNFSQERIYEYLITNNINHFSCLHSTTGWCNNCHKCHTTAYFAHKHGSRMYEPYGLAIPGKYAQDEINTYSMPKGVVLDFSQAYDSKLFSLCKPIEANGFAHYYETCVKQGHADNNQVNQNVFYDLGNLNSMSKDLLEKLATFWK